MSREQVKYERSHLNNTCRPDSLSPLVTPLGSKVAGPQAVIAVIGAFTFAKNIDTYLLKVGTPRSIIHGDGAIT